MIVAPGDGPADGRPDFAAAIYAAGANSNPPPEGPAPPLFIAVASDDQSVGMQGSIDLMKRGNRPPPNIREGQLLKLLFRDGERACGEEAIEKGCGRHYYAWARKPRDICPSGHCGGSVPFLRDRDRLSAGPQWGIRLGR
jgi:hypothetical protein